MPTSSFSLSVIKAIYPDTMSDTDFVSAIFLNVFGRPVASGGLAYRAGQLTGKSRGPLVLDMTTAALNTPDGSAGKAYFYNRVDVDVTGYALFKQGETNTSRSVSELTDLLKNVDGGGAGVVGALGMVDTW